MKIDMSKVNLLEKDIEDWLYENPSVLTTPYKNIPIDHWIGRQYELPSGIADLIGVRENGMLVVVEIKNVAINKAAILQVCRYGSDLKCILSNRSEYRHRRDWEEPNIEMVVFGPSIDAQTFTEAQAVGVRVFRFSVEFTLEANGLGWTDEHRNETDKQHEEIAARPEWDIFGETIQEVFARQTQQLKHEGSWPLDYSDIILEPPSDTSDPIETDNEGDDTPL